VAQGNGEAVDVVRCVWMMLWRKLKEPKRFKKFVCICKKVDGTKIISIIRDIVEIEEAYAKSVL
jgi:hypothetical protein